MRSWDIRWNCMKLRVSARIVPRVRAYFGFCSTKHEVRKLSYTNACHVVCSTSSNNYTLYMFMYYDDFFFWYVSLVMPSASCLTRSSDIFRCAPTFFVFVFLYLPDWVHFVTTTETPSRHLPWNLSKTWNKWKAYSASSSDGVSMVFFLKKKTTLTTQEIVE